MESVCAVLCDGHNWDRDVCGYERWHNLKGPGPR